VNQSEGTGPPHWGANSVSHGRPARERRPSAFSPSDSNGKDWRAGAKPRFGLYPIHTARRVSDCYRSCYRTQLNRAGRWQIDQHGGGRTYRLKPDTTVHGFARPPALLLRPVPVEVPGDAPVVVPLMADPPAAAPPAEPVPLCARAKLPESATAAASAMLVSFMMIFLLL
jgi:hypothetical protein